MAVMKAALTGEKKVVKRVDSKVHLLVGMWVEGKVV